MLARGEVICNQIVCPHLLPVAISDNNRISPEGYIRDHHRLGGHHSNLLLLLRLLHL